MKNNFISFVLKAALLSCTVFVNREAVAQSPVNHTFLLDCFKNSPVDSFEIEIKKLGELMSYNYEGDSATETGLSWFTIPEEKRSMKRSKIAELAAARQTETWKNNSKIIFYERTETGAASIIDLRLHLLIEDIYFQVLIICEKDRVYEIDCFRDTNDKICFDNLARRIKTGKCP